MTDVFAILVSFHALELEPKGIDLLISSHHPFPGIILQKLTTKGPYTMFILLPPSIRQYPEDLQKFLHDRLSHFMRDIDLDLAGLDI